MSNDGPDAAGDESGDEPDGVLVFELDDWTTEERTSLELRLAAGGIAHRWETGSGREAVYGLEPSAAWEVGTDLVVAEQDADAVDALLDEIEFVDELEADDGDDEGDEAVYQVMADLYVAVDRLKARVEDPAVAGAFFDAADAAIDVPPPFGIDPAMWARVQSLTAGLVDELERDEPDYEVVAPRATELREMLFHYV